MSINGVSGTGTDNTTNNSSATEKKKDPLGRDVFLQLLVTQMQHQDPLQPQENGEFLAQLAQFSSLENLQQIKDDMAALRSLIEGTAETTGTTASSTSSSSSSNSSYYVDPSAPSVYTAPGY